MVGLSPPTSCPTRSHPPSLRRKIWQVCACVWQQTSVLSTSARLGRALSRTIKWGETPAPTSASESYCGGLGINTNRGHLLTISLSNTAWSHDHKYRVTPHKAQLWKSELYHLRADSWKDHHVPVIFKCLYQVLVMFSTAMHRLGVVFGVN